MRPLDTKAPEPTFESRLVWEGKCPKGYFPEEVDTDVIVGILSPSGERWICATADSDTGATTFSGNSHIIFESGSSFPPITDSKPGGSDVPGH